MGWRLDLGLPVHTHRECCPAKSQSKLTSVHLAKTFDGRHVLIDDLTKHPIFVAVCKRCLAREDAHG